MAILPFIAVIGVGILGLGILILATTPFLPRRF